MCDKRDSGLSVNRLGSAVARQSTASETGNQLTLRQPIKKAAAAAFLHDV